MRTLLLTSAAVLGLAVAGPAFAQTSTPDIRPGHVPGVGVSEPASSQASNIVPSDTHSPIAPTLPTPPDSANAGPAAFLKTAQQALANHQTGEAQEALERAETRLLDRATAPSAANTPDTKPVIDHVTAARDALARGDTSRANDAIMQALGDLQAGTAASATPVAAPPMVATTAPVSATPSTSTYVDLKPYDNKVAPTKRKDEHEVGTNSTN